jgi:hypothetical protein
MGRTRSITLTILFILIAFAATAVTALKDFSLASIDMKEFQAVQPMYTISACPGSTAGQDPPPTSRSRAPYTISPS